MVGSTKRQACVMAVWAFVPVASQALATEVSGDQSGTWTLAESPYLLVGDVLVPPGETLAIEPGVIVRAQGHYKITVDHSTLLAVGTAEAPILMTADDTTTGWRGIRLETADDDTLISYCAIEYAKGTEAYWADVRGGALMVRNCSPTISSNVFQYNSSHNENYNGCGGAICTEYSDAMILNNIILNNSADSGGGITIAEYGAPVVSGNILIDNTASSAGGGMYLGARSSPLIEYNVLMGNHSSGWGGGGINSWTSFIYYGTFATIRNNVIAYNTTSTAGGGIYSRYDRAVITNNVIAYNSASQGGGIHALNYPPQAPLVTNCIVWGNTASDGPQVDLNESTGSAIWISYSDVQDGWAGEGNIDDDPFFVDLDGPDDVPGTEDDNLRLSPGSPCINTGDPDYDPPDGTDLDGHARVLCRRVDMGAYEFGIGDYDCNQVVDLADFANWVSCFTGPEAGPYPDGCEPFDFDFDTDVDLLDFGVFQRTVTGVSP